MDITKNIIIKSSKTNIYKCLLNPTEISKWWQCDVVVDLKIGGVWTVAWGIREDQFGHETIITGYIQEFKTNEYISIYIEPVFINISLSDTIEQSTLFSVTQQNYPDPNEAETALQTWMDSFLALKNYVEQKYPLISNNSIPTKQINIIDSPDTKSAIVQEIDSTSSLLDHKGEKSGLYHLKKDELQHSTDRIEKQTVHEISFNNIPQKQQVVPVNKNNSKYKILDDGGFNITNPIAKIVSYTKESGFGYVEHSELGKIMFDYEICDFVPDVGDEVVILALKKAWNGQPKCKRLACPAKGSKIK